jgi:hypothetical protein
MDDPWLAVMGVQHYPMTVYEAPQGVVDFFDRNGQRLSPSEALKGSATAADTVIGAIPFSSRAEGSWPPP